MASNSVARTFGLVVVISGVVLTIYGHVASRTCLKCVKDKDGDNYYKDNHDPTLKPGEPIREPPSLPNEKTIKYARIIGPCAFVGGLFVIAVACLIERRMQYNENMELSKKEHWTEEAARAAEEQRNHQNQIDSNSNTVNTDSTTIDIDNNDTSLRDSNGTGAIACNTGANSTGVQTFMNDPPPSYEDTVIAIGRSTNNKINDDENSIERPPSYEESTTGHGNN